MPAEQCKLPAPGTGDVNDRSKSGQVTANVIVKNFQFHPSFQILGDQLPVCGLSIKYVSKSHFVYTTAGKTFTPDKLNIAQNHINKTPHLPRIHQLATISTLPKNPLHPARLSQLGTEPTHREYELAVKV